MQTSGLNHLLAHFHFDWGLYPDGCFHPDSGLSQGGTDSCCLHLNSGLHPNSGLILTVAFLIASSQQHSTHFYFFKLCISKYVLVELTHYYCGRRAIAARGKKQNANDSFGIGFHVLKDHVLNCLMTGRCPRKSLQLRPKFHSLFLQNSFDFQKSTTFKRT